MPTYNNQWFQALEPSTDFTTGKCVVKVKSWPTEQDKINDTNLLPLAMCVFSFTTWDFEAINTKALAQYTNWVPFNKELIENLLLPTEVFSLSKARLIKAASISASCEQFIVAGFDSSALGTIHTYPSNRDDQLNLSGTVQRSMMLGVLPTDTFEFLCKDLSGVWAYAVHTATQIQQAGKDAYSYILNARVKNATLQAQIAASTTQAQLDTIIW